MTGSESVRRVALYVRVIGSNTPRGWLNIAVFSTRLYKVAVCTADSYLLQEGKEFQYKTRCTNFSGIDIR